MNLLLISVPSWAKIVLYRLNLLKDVFRQPYAMHVLYLPCTHDAFPHAQVSSSFKRQNSKASSHTYGIEPRAPGFYHFQ